MSQVLYFFVSQFEMHRDKKKLETSRKNQLETFDSFCLCLPVSSLSSHARLTCSTSIPTPRGPGSRLRQQLSTCPSFTTRLEVSTGSFLSKAQRYHSHLISEICIWLLNRPGRHQLNCCAKHDVHQNVTKVWTMVGCEGQHCLWPWL